MKNKHVHFFRRVERRRSQGQPMIKSPWS